MASARARRKFFSFVERQAVDQVVKAAVDDGNFTEIAQGDLNPGDQVIVGESRPQTNTQQGAP